MRIAARPLEAILAHARAGHPFEVCGVLVGRADAGGVAVVEAVAVENRERTAPRTRYEIAPEDLLRLQREARATGRDIAGFYHSHPDHPAVPSEYDREHGLPFFHYVVVAVGAESPGEAASYVLSEDRGVFEREELLIEAPGRQ